MLELLEGYKGSLVINGKEYASIKEAVQALDNYNGELSIKLNVGAKNLKTNSPSPKEVSNDIYQIKVRQYMTKPSNSQFTFHDKWNKGIPMPMRVMVGKIISETPGMFQMELWAEITEETTSHCMKCGRVLTNPVSQYFGIGPECGGHDYTHPFDTDEELKVAVKQMQEQLKEIKWSGWVIKSGIEEKTLIRKE